ncbi:MAG: Uma2 family endonuclease [Spirosomaceae bacterium]|jgi:Uma2 family endonuclease|nr:Uma2 family endonuclease [Spirosomataceae bacterium]
MVAVKTYTLDDYYRFIERAEGQFEFVDGQIIELHAAEAVEESLIDYVLSDDFDANELPTFAMPTRIHDILVSNLHILFGLLLRSQPFRIYSQATQLRGDLFAKNRVPDLIVVHKNNEQRTARHEVQNPILLVEVWSKSTQRIDQSEKLEDYQGLPSLQEYVMVAQDQPRVTVFRRLSARKWEEEIYTELNETVELTSLGIQIQMQEIYEGIDEILPPMP